MGNLEKLHIRNPFRINKTNWLLSHSKSMMCGRSEPSLQHRVCPNV
ncbi:unnamed protein product [Moneuplotes crassus]|uniref:Uncharacterized protein n=1 Tax=Euplotes crassus TaxID=5936 RepID=A0AAD1XCB9_EUPCR|nr:unnamed protein product [Moneuplotes crassus]